MKERRTVLRVVTVAVALAGLCGGLAAPAEEEKKAPPAAKSGKVVGILVSKTEAEVVVRPEGKVEEQK
jgi:deoxyinosine 3'endonuclease (endonuclease V)